MGKKLEQAFNRRGNILNSTLLVDKEMQIKPPSEE